MKPLPVTIDSVMVTAAVPSCLLQVSLLWFPERQSGERNAAPDLDLSHLPGGIFVRCGPAFRVTARSMSDMGQLLGCVSAFVSMSLATYAQNDWSVAKVRQTLRRCFNTVKLSGFSPDFELRENTFDQVAVKSTSSSGFHPSLSLPISDE